MDTLTDRPTNLFAEKYRYAATYGLYFGLYLAFFYVLAVLFPENGVVRFICSIGNLGSFVLSYVLIKKYRDEAMGGYMPFGWAWSFGLWFSVFTALIMSVFHFVHFQFIQPDYIENTLNQSLLMLEEMDYPTEQLAALAEFGVPTAIQFTFVYIWFYIIGGAVLALIYAAFLSRRDVLGGQSQGPDEDEYIPYQDISTDADKTEEENGKDSQTDASEENE